MNGGSTSWDWQWKGAARASKSSRLSHGGPGTGSRQPCRPDIVPPGWCMRQSQTCSAVGLWPPAAPSLNQHQTLGTKTKGKYQLVWKSQVSCKPLFFFPSKTHNSWVGSASCAHQDLSWQQSRRILVILKKWARRSNPHHL